MVPVALIVIAYRPKLFLYLDPLPGQCFDARRCTVLYLYCTLFFGLIWGVSSPRYRTCTGSILDSYSTVVGPGGSMAGLRFRALTERSNSSSSLIIGDPARFSTYTCASSRVFECAAAFDTQHLQDQRGRACLDVRYLQFSVDNSHLLQLNFGRLASVFYL